MADLVWLHEEALRLTHPVFAAAGPDAACVFVWDAARLAESHVGLKRQLFIYETLCGMASARAMEIHQGQAELVLPHLAEVAGAGRVLVPASPDPVIRAAIAGLRRAVPRARRPTARQKKSPATSSSSLSQRRRGSRIWTRGAAPPSLKIDRGTLSRRLPRARRAC